MVKKMTPVNYAEDVLNVHGVYKEAEEAHTDLEQALSSHVDAQALVREIANSIEDREHDLAIELRGDNPDLSQSAFERLVKDKIREDDRLKKLRSDMREALSRRDEAEQKIEGRKYHLRILEARMKELGGLLTFYASVKQSKD